MTPNQVVAGNMLRLRKERGWTQKVLAAKLGWSAQIVCAAERSAAPKRNRRFTVDDLVLITEAFGVAPADLLAPILPCPTCKDSPPAGFTCQQCGAAGGPPSPASQAAGSASGPAEAPVTSLQPAGGELRDVPATDQAIRGGGSR
jgi:transcriptional regulator with XRE-family HTH domain